jgi:hypothetical protein
LNEQIPLARLLLGHHWIVADYLPFVLGSDLPYPGKPNWISWNFMISGTAVFTVSIITVINDRLWQKWAQIIVGLWLSASPWVLAFAGIFSTLSTLGQPASPLRHWLFR